MGSHVHCVTTIGLSPIKRRQCHVTMSRDRCNLGEARPEMEAGPGIEAGPGMEARPDMEARPGTI